MATISEIRVWLRENGYEPGARGRLHPDHLAAWKAAHNGDSVEKPVAFVAAKAAPANIESGGHSLTREEMETTITYTMADENVQIYSAIVRDISKMRKDPNYIEVKSSFVGGSEQAWFTCPVAKFRFTSRKEMNLSDEERQRRRERLTSGRNS